MATVRFALMTAFALCVAPRGAVADPSFSKVIVFGDSNVDSGERQENSLFNLTGGLVNQPPNVGGRSCNGPVVVEYVADFLGVPLVNFGVGGATTGATNLVFQFLPLPQIEFTGTLSQIDAFKRTLGNKQRADRNALYIYWAGSNDLFGATEVDAPMRIEAALDNVAAGLSILTDRGARYILVATRTTRPDYYGENNVNGTVFNARLRKLVQDLNAAEYRARIEIFEAFDLLTDMAYNPAAYGFIEPTALCIEDAECATSADVAATYIQWDGAHKTTRAHEVMAQQMLLQAHSLRARGPRRGPR